MRSLLLAAMLLLPALPACSTYRDDLARSQRAFEDNQHERALAILRMLEPDTSHLDTTEQAHYAYLRGMTDFRIGYKADARHWLAVAKAMDEKTPGDIPSQWRKRLDQSLAELDGQVWTAGMESLSIGPTSGSAKKHPSARKHPVKTRRAPDQATEEEEEQAPKPPPKKKQVDDEDE